MDLEDGCVGPAPHYIPHFKVHLENRKGWQKEKGYDGPRTSAYDGLTLAEQQADEIKAISMISMNRISPKLI